MKKLLPLITFTLSFVNLNSQSLTVSPNPVYQRTLASYTLVNTDSVSVQILDMTGKIILTPRPTSLLSPGIYQDSIILDNFPPGIYYVSLTIKTGSSQVIKLIKTGPVGIEQFNQNSQALIYPNPFHNVITIDFGNNLSQPITYTIYNSLGQIVHKGTLQNANEKIDLSLLSSGFYSLKIDRNSESKTFNILKH